MRRSDREQSREFALALIDRCPHGVMAVSDAENGPYCVPLSFARKGDVLYFHCAREGRKLDLLRKDGRVCVTFVGQDEPAFEEPNNFTTSFQSAIVFGKAVELTGDTEKIEGLRVICQALLPAYMAHFDDAITHSLPVTSVWRVDMEEVTAKARSKRGG